MSVGRVVKDVYNGKFEQYQVDETRLILPRLLAGAFLGVQVSRRLHKPHLSLVSLLSVSFSRYSSIKIALGFED